ncbi:MAG: cupin domain-containing protein [Acidobacteriota bacterium]
MSEHRANYQVTTVDDLARRGRVTLHAELNLTGSEISFNELPPGAGVPFLHRHRRNEEVYIILAGTGRFQVDGEEFEVTEGSVIRVDPAGERGITADDAGPLRYLCIQTEANSLRQFTEADAIISDARPTWRRPPAR